MKKIVAVFLCSGMLCAASAWAVVAQPAGKAIVDKACSRCHGIKKVESASKDAAQWEATLDRMIKKGAKVGPEDRAAVLEYLKTLNK
ncbi:MAG: hypothetical protein R6W75_06585 [Smithellaceae bacterium]